MVDINPAETVSKYTPRQTTIVDAVAESKRIAEQQMRSNPLKDAKIDSGLTEWIGNYGGSLVWIGEIGPNDANLTDQYGNPKPQRGFVVQRDDPGQKFAILMYDGTPVAGEPLKQTLTLSDGSGFRLLQEAFNQLGRRFPDKSMPMYPKNSMELNSGVDAIAWSGAANMIGTHINFDVEWSSAATISSFLRFSGGGVTVNTPTVTVAGSHAYGGTVDLTAIYQVADFVDIQWHVWRSGGAGTYSARVNRMRNYTSDDV